MRIIAQRFTGKRFLLLFGIVFLLMQSCRQEENVMELQEQTDDNPSMSRDELNQEIIDVLLEQQDLRWDDLSDEALTSAFLLSDKYITVAWDKNATSDVEKEAIIDFIYQSEGKLAGAEGVILEVDDELKLLHAQIDKVETLLGLRRLDETAALDVYYEVFTEEEIQEMAQNLENNLPGSVGRITGNPHYFDHHEIEEAWNAGLSGAGLEVAVIDNGPQVGDPIWGQNGDPHQANPQPNRSVSKKGRHKPMWWWPWASYDGVYSQGNLIPLVASHGSDMLKVIGNPDGGVNPIASKGIAYRSDIRSVRGANIFWIDIPRNVYGVTKSFKYLANKSDVRIISMSMGGFWNWVSVERAIEKCYNNGKMIISSSGTAILSPPVSALLGTSPGAMTLFPARFKPYTLAATGVKNTGDPKPTQWCTWCFGKADFVVEFNSGQGSSSQSAAATAGMAALIWAREPFLSRDDVIAKMKAAADWPNSPDLEFGYGRINMQTYLDNEGI